MKYLLRKVAYHYRAGGFGGVVRKGADYTRRVSWSDCPWVIYKRSLTAGVPCVTESVLRRELGLQELVVLGYYKARDYPYEIERRFDERNVCHGFFADDQLVTVGWSAADYLELDCDVRFPCPGAVGLFDFYTFEAFRSRGHYASALRGLAPVMQRAGFASAYIAVDPKNSPSIKGIERAGFQQELLVTRRRRFGASVVTRKELRMN